MAARPYSAGEAKVSDVSCRIAPARDGMGLMLDIAMPSAGGKETVVVEAGDPGIWASDAQSTREGGRLVARTELIHNS
ncbi:MAG: hypothetical protein GWO39_08810, partial [Gammaproteobacteria bacterium]|nr:hypothetical protein [Gammaproteobacteria bacterium]NIT63867.1 hypothetical protein [Gammaproteobacteria bacterium]NIV20871.1 hypothetical protein [Gammaproteobacteria bacterium]NIY32447.1 hypothetical protein [Gammaproteobacteria bacterium]